MGLPLELRLMIYNAYFNAIEEDIYNIDNTGIQGPNRRYGPKLHGEFTLLKRQVHPLCLAYKETFRELERLRERNKPPLNAIRINILSPDLNWTPGPKRFRVLKKIEPVPVCIVHIHADPLSQHRVYLGYLNPIFGVADLIDGLPRTKTLRLVVDDVFARLLRTSIASEGQREPCETREQLGVLDGWRVDTSLMRLYEWTRIWDHTGS